MVLSPYQRAQLVESLAALGREGAARGVEIHRDRGDFSADTCDQLHRDLAAHFQHDPMAIAADAIALLHRKAS